MKKLIAEFKEFAVHGNALELAIGVIIGAAFKSIVDSVVNDILMPIIGILLGGKDFSGLAVTVGDAKIVYGSFIQQVINFLIVAIFLFAVVKAANAFNRKKDEPEEEPAKPDDVKLLEEILAEIKNK